MTPPLFPTFFRSMFRRLLLLSMSAALCLTTVACGSPGDSQTNRQGDRPANSRPEQTRLPDGQYSVQQATYNDGDGEYTVMLLDTKPGVPSSFRTQNLPLAQLTPDEVKAGQKNYLKVENGQPSLHIPEDFKIEYVHNVAENVTNPQTGQSETRIVRQEPSFWTPFAGSVAGSIAGQAIGSLLFRPQYYVPPVYQSGRPLSGFGGYGSSYGQAVNSYQQRYQSPPAAVRNSQVFRSTGRINTPSYRTPTVSRPSINNGRPTGSGYGSSNLRRSTGSTPSRVNRPSSFGSGRSSAGSRRR